MKWLWNWSKPKISSIVDNSQLEALRNDLTTLQNNVSNIQASLSSYLTNNQSYSLTNTSDKFVINVAKSANYLELQRGGSRKTTIGLGSSSSDNFSIESTGNIVLKPNQYIDANGSSIQNVASPTQANQVTTKQYVDTLTTTNTNSINGLTTRVTNLENQDSSGVKLSMITGQVKTSQIYNVGTTTTLTYLNFFSTDPLSSITLSNGNIITLDKLKKYIIAYDYGFNVLDFINPPKGALLGTFVKQNTMPQLGLITANLPSFNVVYLGNDNPQVVWKTKNPYMNVTLVLSDSVENITKNTKTSTLLSLNNIEDNTLEVISWDNI